VAITTYVLATSIAGMLMGYVGMLVVGVGATGFAPLRFVAPHRWVYDFNPGGQRPIPYVHVLADTGNAGRQILYRGRLRAFGIENNGAFSYLVLNSTEQRFLRLDADDLPGKGTAVPATGPRVPIGGPTAAEGAVMVISGGAIKDVVFQGLELGEVEQGDDATSRAAKLESRLERQRADVQVRLAALERMIQDLGIEIPE
jgi:hypothetical protein